MKSMKKIHLIPFVFLLTLTVSCGGGNGTSNDFEEYYDESWTPGLNALNDAKQPTIKNPKGEFNVLNEMRRSQNKVGLPASGEANILVVPINFKNDDLYQSQLRGVDITFNEEDLKNIEDAFFLKTTENDIYPSVKSYFNSSSYGKLNLSGVVSPVITMPNEYTDYLSKAAAYSITSSLNDIIDYVYDYLFVQTQTYYIGDFDSDNDGRVDAISLICNYPYELTFGDANADYYHQSLLDFENVYFSKDITNIKNTKVNAFSFVSDTFRNSYSMYNANDPHSFIYQVSRMLGIDRYSDKNGNVSTGYYRAPLSYFDMMSGLLGDLNSFSKFQLGWIEPKMISLDDFSSDTLTINIGDLLSTGEAILLNSGTNSKFGEYLLIDLYSPLGVNKYDSENYSLYGLNLFEESAIRVYQVDSRLVRGYGNTYVEYNGEPDFTAKKTLPNEEVISYIYDYAYTNDSVNNYSTSGIINNYALVSLLSKKGANRHMTDFTTILSLDDMFLEGDSFGSSDQIEGFYKDFKFHNGESLNISFTVDKIQNNNATITLRRAK